MAEIKPIQLVPSIATPFKDSRAEGYVSYYTKVGWDRWNLALQQVEQDVKDRKLQYDAAMDLYRDQLKAIADEKQSLQKKIDDIKLKKADVAARRADMMKRMEESRELKRQAEENEKAKNLARVPSVGSGGGGGGGVGPTGIKDPLDEALDELTGGNRTTVDDRLRTLAGGATSANAGARFNQLKGYYDTGGLPSDAATKDITSYALFDTMAKDLASKEGKSTDEVKSNLMISASPEIRDQIKRGAARVEAVRERQAGVSAGTYASQGSYQTDYEIAKFGDLTALDLEAKEYDKLEKEIADRLEKKNNIPTPITPTIEPIDLITAARKTYLDKFGNIPEGVSLRAGGESLTRYKELMPFEITNALKGVQSFFQGYIDREISAAKASSPNGLLTKDETSFAIERGKTAARKALFGNVYTAQEAARVDAGLPPQAEDPSKVLAENLKKEGEDIVAAAPPEAAGQVRADLATPPVAPPVAPPTPAPVIPTQRPLVPTGEAQPPIQKTFPERVMAPAPVVPEKELLIPLSPSNIADRSFLGISPPVTATRESRAPTPVQRSAKELEESVAPPLPFVPSITKPIGGTGPEFISGPPKTPEQKSTKEKTSAFMQGAEKAQATPSAAARDLLKDSVGKYVSAAYEANKAKGPGALPLKDLTSQIISEYSGDMKNQAKAVRLLTQIAYLDDTKNQIK